jgi:ribonuclease P protein component
MARITRGAELQRVAHEGKRIRTTHVEVRVAVSPSVLSPPGRSWHGVRIGLVVPRFNHTAVARNKLKRRLRELARLHILPLNMRCDIVFRVRRNAYNARFDMLSKEIAEVLNQIEGWTSEMRLRQDGEQLI